MSRLCRALVGISLIAIMTVCAGCRSRERSQIFVGRLEEAPSPPAAAEEAAEPTQRPAAIEAPSVGPQPAESPELTASAEEPGAYAEFMAEGYEKYAAGDHKGAARCFLQALAASKRAEAHYALGKAYRKAGESPSLVIYEFEQAVEADPKMTEAVNDLGVAYFSQRRFKDAERAFERAVGQKRSAKHLSNLGAAHYMVRNYSAAVEEFEEALLLDPGRPECFWYLAKIYTNTRQSGRAKRYWKKAIDAYGPASDWGRKGVEELEKLQAEE